MKLTTLQKTIKPGCILSVWDSGEKFADRYSVVFKGYQQIPAPHSHKLVDMREILGLSDNPTHPQGFSQFSNGFEGPHLGSKISWMQLPSQVREHIFERIQV